MEVHVAIYQRYYSSVWEIAVIKHMMMNTMITIAKTQKVTFYYITEL